MKLTTAKVRAAAPRERAYKLPDGHGLHIYVAPNGRKSWRMAFRFGGREKLLTFGRFPDVALAEARAQRDAAKAALRAGIDPAARQADASGSSTFEAAARGWHADRRARWTEVHAADVLASFETHVFPALGATPIAAIDAPAVLRTVRAIEANGAIETARRVRQRISAVFKRAIAEGTAAANPAAAIVDALAERPYVRPKPALVDLTAARGAWAALTAADGAPATRLAAQLLALTAVRSAVVRGARWDEFEELAGPAPLWRVPAARMKLRRAQKRDARFDHLVPLNAPAAAVLRAARALAPGAVHVFARLGRDAPLAENAIADLHARAGLRGRHAPHGWRAAFSTILNERDPADRSAIDLALAHVAVGKVEAAYNRAQLLGVRRRLFETWGALLTADGVEGA